MFAYLILATVLCSAVGLSDSSRVRLIDNGYEGLVIAINPTVPEDPKLIDAIKAMVTDASAYLHAATNNRVFFRNVSILIPSSWASKNYTRPTYEYYGKADVLVHPWDDPADDSPYTHQYGQCGEPGQYIQFTPNFLLDDKNLKAYGPRGRAFVHEWGHFRWGLFDEYSEEEPFYVDGKNPEFTRCSKDITGGIGKVTCRVDGTCAVDKCTIESTGLPEKGCSFLPDEIQTAKESIMGLQWINSVNTFCTAKTHNRLAPNRQNRLCGLSSAWEVMLKHDDFNNTTPASGLTQPTFSLLQTSARVITLVLDKSGSMSAESRLPRLLQAADIFIMQILQEGEMAGIVTFDSGAQTQCGLTRINTASRETLKSCLPRNAGGGTNICAGLAQGFQVLSADDGSASGDEIILMTDGEDGGISYCFEAARNSGCTIHTIALGPNAVEGLANFAELTGGLNFYASDSVNANSLVDAFTSITEDSGDSDVLVIQLESTGQLLTMNQWMDGDVNIDASIGNNTQFVVTWQSTTVPEMNITDPNSFTYQNGKFDIDQAFKTARLIIPGSAKAGTWKYWLVNKAPSTDTLTLTVTSMASSKGAPPITVEAHMRSSSSISLSALTIYAEVKRGTTPVVGANVTALIERPGSATLEIELLDNGASADIKKDDGVYSRYFTQYTSSGRYSLKVRVAGSKGTTRLAPRRGSKAIFIPGIRNGKGELVATQVPAPAGGQVLVPSEDFSRVASGGSFQATVPPGGPLDIYPPSRVLDLTAELQAPGIVSLAWTAPGDDADFGQASKYEIIMSDSIEGLLNSTEEIIVPEDNVTLGNTSDPAVAGSTETFAISIAELQPGNSLYFSVRAIDKNNNKGENSNVASVAPALIVVPTKAPNGGGPPTISKPTCTVYFMVTIITLIVSVFPTS
ncbi:calcium-activated chloride channel regulator 1-like [Lethenteron reissneri]|uniref:calcium-activated chloride channel regulator 1-like n=1 Tax=Lethenteron reissneri TaxID=7753 RepID=UPI002AB7BC70|nr:calcium-activated chloride channel regulator 1-like [Lethenteron reissneri]